MSPDFRGIIGAITTGTGTAFGWLAHVETGLRIVSLIIGIVAGLYTIWHYKNRSSNGHH